MLEQTEPLECATGVTVVAASVLVAGRLSLCGPASLKGDSLLRGQDIDDTAMQRCRRYAELLRRFQ